MASRSSLYLLLCTVALGGCDDKGAGAAGSASAPPSSASAAPSGSAPPTCEELALATVEALRAAPRACKTDADCAVAGPVECKRRGERAACMVAVTKGHERVVDAASAAWRDADCDQGLAEPSRGLTQCRAGSCSIRN